MEPNPNNKNKDIDIEVECDNAEQAFTESKETGHTKLRCLKCGGNFHFYEAGNSYEIWCENNDFDMTFRGI
jgi:hypothetical protein